MNSIATKFLILLGFGFMNFLFDSASEDEKLMHGVIDCTVKQLERKYSMEFCGSGVGMDVNNKFNSCMISLQTYHPMTKDECRAVVFDCANTLLANINNNPKLIPYLAENPFNYNNIEVTIEMLRLDRSLFHPEISAVSINHNEGVVFYTDDPESQFKHKSRVVESYPEALEKLLRTKG